MDKLDLEAIDCARTQLGIDRTHAFACMVSPCTCSANAEDQRDMEAIARLTTLKRRLQSLPQGEAPETPEYAKTHDALFSAIEAGITAVDNSDAGIQTLAAGAAGYVMKRFPGIVLEPQGTARSQEAGTGAPGVRECWVKFVDGAPWAVNIRPYHYMENCEWVRMVEADNQAPRGQKEREA